MATLSGNHDNWQHYSEPCQLCIYFICQDTGAKQKVCKYAQQFVEGLRLRCLVKRKRGDNAESATSQPKPAKRGKFAHMYT